MLGEGFDSVGEIERGGGICCDLHQVTNKMVSQSNITVSHIGIPQGVDEVLDEVAHIVVDHLLQFVSPLRSVDFDVDVDKRRPRRLLGHVLMSSPPS